MKPQKVTISKITETAHWELPWKVAYSEHSIAIQSISMASYVLKTAVLSFVRAELHGRETSIFCDFLKVASCDFTPFYSFLNFDSIKRLFFWDVLGKEYCR